jgi:replicative DNA helicase
MGKTTLAVNMAEYAAVSPDSKASVAIFSMEMPAEQLVTRMLASIGHVPLNSIRSGRISDDDWVRITAATSQLSEARIFIDESPALTPTDLRARARRLKREHGLDLVVVDYLQLMQVPGTKGEPRHRDRGDLTRIEGAGEGAGGAGDCAVAAQSRGRAAQREEAGDVGSAREWINRAGC